MNESFDGSVVEGYSYLIEKVTLPDSNDRHVLACAIQSEADIIITANKKDFPKKDLLDNFDITVYSPDEFISNITKQSPQRSLTAFRVQVSKLRNPPRSQGEVLEILEKLGLRESVMYFRKLLKDDKGPH